MKSFSLVLYTTLGCHLCEQAQAIITACIPSNELDLQLVDIAEDDALIEAYGVRIPVVVLTSLTSSQPSDTELGWPFDEKLFIQWLDNSA